MTAHRASATSPRSRSSSPPDARSIKDGVALLEELGALEPDDRSGRRGLTPLGRRSAQLPVDPRLGRMVLEADRNGCVDEVMVIAAALSIQDPRERPADKQQAAAELHARFADPDSDFLAYLNLWRYLPGAAGRAVVEPVPQAVPGRAPQLPAHPGVAGRPRPAPPGDAPHRAAHRTRRRRRTATRSTSRCWPGCCPTSACADGGDRASTRGARDARFAIAPAARRCRRSRPAG